MNDLTFGSVVQLSDGRVVTNCGVIGIEICDPFTFQRIYNFLVPDYDFYYEAAPLVLLNDNTVLVATHLSQEIICIFNEGKYYEMEIEIDKTRNYYWIYDFQQDIVYIINDEFKIHSKFIK